MAFLLYRVPQSNRSHATAFCLAESLPLEERHITTCTNSECTLAYENKLHPLKYWFIHPLYRTGFTRISKYSYVKNTEVEWGVILHIARLGGCLIARTGKTNGSFGRKLIL
jgi:hypothetical protein